jgi:hypothetical protein
LALEADFAGNCDKTLAAIAVRRVPMASLIDHFMALRI